MPNSQVEQCETCRFWQVDATARNNGQCRRYPPMVLTGEKDSFPTTTATEWCGEFKIVESAK